jgi:hypothetical protein
LAQAHRIGLNGPKTWGDFHIKPIAILGSEGIGGTRNVGHQCSELDLLRIEFELSRLDLGEIEDFVDESQKMGACMVDPVERFN